MSAPDPDISACAGIVQRADPDRFLAIMSAPVPIRAKLFPLFAFNVEVSRAPWITQESMIAEMRLQWWRDALEEIAAGGEVRRHEVVTPLARTITAEHAALLDALIEARRWDIYKDPFDSVTDFRGYLEHTAGTLVQVAASLCGAPQADLVHALGYAHGLAQWARGMPALIGQGRRPFFMKNINALQGEADGALSRISKISISEIPVQARPALFICWQDRLILKRIVKRPEFVLEGRLESSEFRKRLGLFRFAKFGR